MRDSTRALPPGLRRAHIPQGVCVECRWVALEPAHAMPARRRRHPMQARCHAARARRQWRPTGPRPGGICGGRLHGPGLQGARPRPPAVDAVAPDSRSRTHRRTSEAVAPGSPVRVSDGSPRPTCASTATRWPRTPTTVTPVTFRERTWPSTRWVCSDRNGEHDIIPLRSVHSNHEDPQSQVVGPSRISQTSRVPEYAVAALTSGVDGDDPFSETRTGWKVADGCG
jgi:hypothetical protein